MTARIVSCHCQNIRLEVSADLAEVRDCNCSVCAKYGFLHWCVPRDAVKLLTESRMASSYLYRDPGAAHVFCPVCGVGLMYTGYPDDKVSINARCVDDVDVFTLEVARFDGRRLL